MKKQIKITLIIDVDIDGVLPEKVDIANEIGMEVVENIPGVMCECDEYCVFVDSILIDTAMGVG